MAWLGRYFTACLCDLGKRGLKGMSFKGTETVICKKSRKL